MARFPPFVDPIDRFQGAVDPFVDVIRGAMAQVGDAQRYSRTMRDLESSGISGVNPNNRGVWWGSDADRLAQLAARRTYTTDPVAQARFLTLLKQLGYLPRQAA